MVGPSNLARDHWRYHRFALCIPGRGKQHLELAFCNYKRGIYLFIFFETHLYADMGLQFYFMAMNIYGWYHWSRRPPNEKKTFT